MLLQSLRLPEDAYTGQQQAEDSPRLPASSPDLNRSGSLLRSPLSPQSTKSDDTSMEIFGSIGNSPMLDGAEDHAQEPNLTEMFDVDFVEKNQPDDDGNGDALLSMALADFGIGEEGSAAEQEEETILGLLTRKHSITSAVSQECTQFLEAHCADLPDLSFVFATMLVVPTLKQKAGEDTVVEVEDPFANLM